jgi:signal transduction histidine kinase/DNA-binding response OmpR family regulator
MSRQILKGLDPQQYTILVVDDNPTNLKVIVNFLREYQFRLLMANDGPSALQRIALKPPDLILLDVMMPGMDGFEVCRRLQADASSAAIPVIFMTALAGEEDKVRGFEAGAVDYVTKPVQQQEVLARVVTHLTLQQQKRRLQELATELQQANHNLQGVVLELQDANAALFKRSVQLEASSRVGREVTSTLDLDKLLEAVVALIQAQFGYYFVGVWLLDEEQQGVVLEASSVCDGCQPLEPGFTLPLETPGSVIVTVCRSGRPYCSDDIQSDCGRFALKGLPDTCSELILPLHFGERQIGVLDIHSDQRAAFSDEDQTVLQTLADQIAIAIHNARLYSREKELNASKDKFFSIVAHDLRGPFNPLLGIAQLLTHQAQSLSPQEVQEMASGIYRSARNIYDLLENLLHWSRLQRGRIEQEPARLHLQQLVAQNIKLLAENAANKGITLSNHVGDGLFIYADERMMDTVIRNLIANALKFTPTGGRVTISVQPNEQGLAEIAVADTGVGMSRADQAKLFRLDVTHTRQGTAQETGTGLGLIICQEMVERAGGRIWVESELGQGTTVKFTVSLDDTSAWLPAVQDRVEAGQAEPELLILPPPESITILRELALQGNMIDLEKEAARLEARDPQLVLFTTHLRQLAKAFEEEQILALLDTMVAP